MMDYVKLLHCEATILKALGFQQIGQKQVLYMYIYIKINVTQRTVYRSLVKLIH